VVLTRVKDKAVSNTERAELANVTKNADILLSLHVGEAKGKAAATTRGAAVNYASDTSRSLASALRDSMINLLKMNDRGTKKVPTLWFKRVKIPSVLLTVGYLTHPDEGRWITDDAHRAEIAGAIADGLESFFEQNKAAFASRLPARSNEETQ
ncbi:MAG: N-acetylmuramoyl-L-alanine amidase family protein, partial [bacterium]